MLITRICFGHKLSICYIKLDCVGPKLSICYIKLDCVGP